MLKSRFLKSGLLFKIIVIINCEIFFAVQMGWSFILPTSDWSLPQPDVYMTVTAEQTYTEEFDKVIDGVRIEGYRKIVNNELVEADIRVIFIGEGVEEHKFFKIKEDGNLISSFEYIEEEEVKNSWKIDVKEFEPYEESSSKSWFEFLTANFEKSGYQMLLNREDFTKVIPTLRGIFYDLKKFYKKYPKKLVMDFTIDGKKYEFYLDEDTFRFKPKELDETEFDVGEMQQVVEEAEATREVEIKDYEYIEINARKYPKSFTIVDQEGEETRWDIEYEGKEIVKVKAHREGHMIYLMEIEDDITTIEENTYDRLGSLITKHVVISGEKELQDTLYDADGNIINQKIITTQDMPGDTRRETVVEGNRVITKRYEGDLLTDEVVEVDGREYTRYELVVEDENSLVYELSLEGEVVSKVTEDKLTGRVVRREAGGVVYEIEYDEEGNPTVNVVEGETDKENKQPGTRIIALPPGSLGEFASSDKSSDKGLIGKAYYGGKYSLRVLPYVYVTDGINGTFMPDYTEEGYRIAIEDLVEGESNGEGPGYFITEEFLEGKQGTTRVMQKVIALKRVIEDFLLDSELYTSFAEFQASETVFSVAIKELEEKARDILEEVGGDLDSFLQEYNQIEDTALAEFLNKKLLRYLLNYSGINFDEWSESDINALLYHTGGKKPEDFITEEFLKGREGTLRCMQKAIASKRAIENFLAESVYDDFDDLVESEVHLEALEEKARSELEEVGDDLDALLEEYRSITDSSLSEFLNKKLLEYMFNYSGINFDEWSDFDIAALLYHVFPELHGEGEPVGSDKAKAKMQKLNLWLLTHPRGYEALGVDLLQTINPYRDQDNALTIAGEVAFWSAVALATVFGGAAIWGVATGAAATGGALASAGAGISALRGIFHLGAISTRLLSTVTLFTLLGGGLSLLQGADPLSDQFYFTSLLGAAMGICYSVLPSIPGLIGRVVGGGLLRFARLPSWLKMGLTRYGLEVARTRSAIMPIWHAIRGPTGMFRGYRFLTMAEHFAEFLVMWQYGARPAARELMKFSMRQAGIENPNAPEHQWIHQLTDIGALLITPAMLPGDYLGATRIISVSKRPDGAYEYVTNQVVFEGGRLKFVKYIPYRHIDGTTIKMPEGGIPGTKMSTLALASGATIYSALGIEAEAAEEGGSYTDRSFLEIEQVFKDLWENPELSPEKRREILNAFSIFTDEETLAKYNKALEDLSYVGIELVDIPEDAWRDEDWSESLDLWWQNPAFREYFDGPFMYPVSP